MDVNFASMHLNTLWSDLHLNPGALKRATLLGEDPIMGSSFAIGTCAQTSIAAAALAATELGKLRNLPEQNVTVNMFDALLECTGHYTLNGTTTPKFAELSGLYPCADGWIRIHANFEHHRDRALEVFKLQPNATREQLEKQTVQHNATEVENKILANNGACARVRSFEQWDKLEQARAVEALPLVQLTKIGEAEPKTLSPLSISQAPLTDIKVLDLTRILAGPVAGRTLAAYGADVMLVNSPNLPNIDNIAETSRGKLSTHIDLLTHSGQLALQHLLTDTHVFLQAYRPGALADKDLSADTLAEKYPGIVYANLSAYGHTGPWCNRRGYDSLLQSASGFNIAEAESRATQTPTAFPVQILDYASGFLLAYGIQAALLRQATEGGSWQVDVSLARTGLWLRSMGQTKDWQSAASIKNPEQYMQSYTSNYGDLRALPHAARLSHSTVQWQRASCPPGTHTPSWDALHA